MPDITAVGEILIDLTQSGVNELGIPVFATGDVVVESLYVSEMASIFG